MSNPVEEMLPDAMVLDDEYADADFTLASSDISLGPWTEEEDDTSNQVTFVSRSSDISLGAESEEEEKEDADNQEDVMSASRAEEEDDYFDDNSTIASMEDDDEVQDIDMDPSKNEGIDGNRNRDGDQNDLFDEDSLSLTMETTNRGTILVEARGQVPLQRTGRLTIMSHLQATLAVSVVTDLLLLSDPRYLKGVKFSQVSFTGTIQDYENFAAALSRLYNMEKLHMDDCNLLHASGARPLDTILFGIANRVGTLPKLRHVELYAVDIDVEPKSSIGPASLASLVRSKPSLTKLSLEDITLGEDHVVELARAIENHENLKVLKLWCCAVEDRGMVAMAKMLEKNTCVEKLEFSYNEIGEVGCVAVAEALHHNNTLKELYLVENKKIVCGGEGYEALLKMIERNHSIQELLLEPSPEVDSDFCFYLFVNRHRFLLENENITKRQLVDVLHSRSTDINFLYLFLKAKPTLCDCL